MTVIEEIAAERQRQIDKEGWSPEHDDGHTRGSLARAAAAYANFAAEPDQCRAIYDSESYVPYMWPWSPSGWKPKDQRRDLIRAGALIVAEVERLDRTLGSNKCPKCGSHSPELHPAVQHEGEVQPCHDPFHQTSDRSDSE